ncbi:MAG: hypothetical protein AB8B81_03705 [Halioglobus sp.]
MAVDHEAIRKILGEQDENADNSLRAKSLQRAMSQQVPKTLTPHEWEQWYAEHGVPESHRAKGTKVKKAWWRFWVS